MAFYRCGGGGIPSSLKTDMNAVLNKKFGTTGQNYPPNGWPDDVNLLGKLPEKTVSGSIAHITDGADEVPIKSWDVEIAPTLTGKSAIECTQINSDNLFLLPSNDFSVSGVDFKIGSDSLTIDGTSTANISSKDSNFKTYFSFGLPKGTYYFTRGTWTKATYVYKLADDSTALVTNSGSFTLTDYTEIYIGFYIGTGQTVSEVTFYGYLKQGSSASSYSPQPHPTQYTASLGRTVYGGTAEVVNGNCEPFNLVSLNRSPQQAKRDYGITVNTQNENTLNITTTGVAYACERLFYSFKKGTYAIKYLATSSDSYTPTISIYRANGTGVKHSIQPNTLTTFTLSEDTNIDIRLFASGSGDTTIRTVEFTNFQIEKGSTVHDYSPYFEPFTFTPIPTPETALGVNNFWADEGDSEVTYRADINLALGGQ